MPAPKKTQSKNTVLAKMALIKAITHNQTCDLYCKCNVETLSPKSNPKRKPD
jgi:hypothetical protein